MANPKISKGQLLVIAIGIFIILVQLWKIKLYD